MTETTDAPNIFAPLWKRKWLILAVGLLVAAGTYFYYKRQPHVYAVSTQLFLGSAEEQAQLNGGGGSTRKSSSSDAAAQAAVINSGLVKDAVHKQLRAERGKVADAHVALRGKAVAAAKEKSAFITITAQARNAKAAALLANVTSQVYVRRLNRNHERGVHAAIALARRQLHRIEATREAASAPKPQEKTAGTSTGTSGTQSSTTSKAKAPAASTGKGTVSTAVTLQEANLSAKINQLEAQLSGASVKQVEAAKPARAEMLAPKPRKNAIFGFAIGLVLAGFGAYVLDRLDRRLRSLARIEAIFQTQILTALPSVRRPILQREGQPTPSKLLREPTRRLHSTLDVGGPNILNGDAPAHPRVLLFVSADPGDGKSTLVADLALVQRDAGEHVAVIEADFRRPVQAKLLGVEGSRGLADVLDGEVPVNPALQKLEAVHAAPGPHLAVPSPGGVATLAEAPSEGSVSVLLGGAQVANPPALLARPIMNDLLRSLAHDFDYVLIDAPVPLQVSDVMPLLRVVDGIVIVARVGHTSETSAQRLVQLLARTATAPVLGVVANAVPNTEIEKYGFAPASDRVRWRRKLFGR